MVITKYFKFCYLDKDKLTVFGRVLVSGIYVTKELSLVLNRPGIAGGSISLERIALMSKTGRYSPELRKRTAHLFQKQQAGQHHIYQQ